MTGYFSLIGIGSMFEFLVSVSTGVFGEITGDFHLQFSMKESSMMLF
jgi:hypothetical protein